MYLKISEKLQSVPSFINLKNIIFIALVPNNNKYMFVVQTNLRERYIKDNSPFDQVMNNRPMDLCQHYAFEIDPNTPVGKEIFDEINKNIEWFLADNPQIVLLEKYDDGFIYMNKNIEEVFIVDQQDHFDFHFVFDVDSYYYRNYKYPITVGHTQGKLTLIKHIPKTDSIAQTGFEYLYSFFNGQLD